MTVTSKPKITTSCYIFVDHTGVPILAGRYMIDEQGLGHFTYGQSYVKNPTAYPLDPINLPFTEPLRIFHPLNGKGAFGVLSDSTPDNWGRRLISSIHSNPPRNEVEWVLESGGNGVGCIVANAKKSLPQLRKALHSFPEMEEFFILADRFEAGKEIPEEMLHLIEFGSSMGGLRPKLTITHEGNEWIAKINRIDDKFDISRVEYATMQMAQDAGINIPNMQLQEINGRPILLVERFDRNVTNKKLHYISAHSLINAYKISEKDASLNYSYMGIADIAKRIAENPLAAQEQLYRRMVFNVLVGNSDDHMKNHGFLMTNYTKKLYSLSPAFDVLPHLDAPQRLQSIGIGSSGREASIENLLSSAGRFQLTKNQAVIILQEIQEIVINWQKYYKKAGVSLSDINILKRCFLMEHS